MWHPHKSSVPVLLGSATFTFILVGNNILSSLSVVIIKPSCLDSEYGETPIPEIYHYIACLFPSKAFSYIATQSFLDPIFLPKALQEAKGSLIPLKSQNACKTCSLAPLEPEGASESRVTYVMGERVEISPEERVTQSGPFRQEGYWLQPRRKGNGYLCACFLDWQSISGQCPGTGQGNSPGTRCLLTLTEEGQSCGRQAIGEKGPWF